MPQVAEGLEFNGEYRWPDAGPALEPPAIVLAEAQLRTDDKSMSYALSKCLCLGYFET